MGRIKFEIYNIFIRFLSGFIWFKKERKHFRDKSLEFYELKTQCKKNKSSNEYKIISLGLHCLARTILTEQGLKPSKAQGELSYPFDLALHSLETVIHCLETDFLDYFNDLLYNKETEIWENSKYYAHYNHDIDCGENEKEKLIHRFQNRIKNFRNLIKNKNIFIYFVIASPSNESSINKLYKILKRLRNNTNFKLLVIDMESKLDKKLVEKNIIMFQLHHPFLYQHNWWKDEYKNSTAGKEYFRLIAEFVKQEIEKDYKVINYKEEKCYQ